MTISIAKSIALASLASSNIEVSRATSAEVAIPVYFDGSGANIFMQKEKAWKITRRLMFELEWRFRGGLVYSKYGLCNKLYDVCY